MLSSVKIEDLLPRVFPELEVVEEKSDNFIFLKHENVEEKLFIVKNMIENYEDLLTDISSLGASVTLVEEKFINYNIISKMRLDKNRYILLSGQEIFLF